VTPIWGGGEPPPEEPRTGSHPAAGGDWAQDIDWEDPRSLEEQAAAKAGRSRWGGRGRTPRAPGPPRERRAPRTPRERRIVVRRAVALAALVIAIIGAWFAVSLFQPFHGGGSGSVTVNIPTGYSATQIGDLLARDGVVSSGFFFNLRANLDGKRSELRAGVYSLKYGMSYSAALSALTGQSGNAGQISFTIPEGLTRDQVAVLAKKAGLRGDYVSATTASASGFSPQAYGAHKDVHSLEGFLFPDTYFVYRHSYVKPLIEEQLADFKRNLALVNLSYAKSRNLTAYDVVIIASIIEREAQRSSDGPKVAGVIYNRLREGIALGLDTTLLYYLHNPPGGSLTQAQLNLPTLYNTRLHTGLPPTPISNPGLAALRAAAHPTKSNYLYFVVKPNACGALAYATNLAEFNVEVAAYNTAVKADGGKLPDRCPTAKK
jgi:uncharacterized YceG family protein